MANLIFVKLGGSAITNKNRQDTLNPEILSQAAKELAECDCPMLIGHGGGSFAHPVAATYKMQDGMILQGTEGFNKTRQGVTKLGALVMQALETAGIPAVYIPTFACTLMNKGNIVEMFTTPIEAHLRAGKTPVMPGDAVLDSSKGCSIASTELVFKHLAEKLKPSRIVVGTDVDGVFTSDPKTTDNAELISKITKTNIHEVIGHVGGAVGQDVTGGMKHKVRTLYEVSKFGIPVQIVNMTKPGLLKKAVLGKKAYGTIIK